MDLVTFCFTCYIRGKSCAILGCHFCQLSYIWFEWPVFTPKWLFLGGKYFAREKQFWLICINFFIFKNASYNILSLIVQHEAFLPTPIYAFVSFDLSLSA